MQAPVVPVWFQTDPRVEQQESEVSFRVAPAEQVWRRKVVQVPVWFQAESRVEQQESEVSFRVAPAEQVWRRKVELQEAPVVLVWFQSRFEERESEVSFQVELLKRFPAERMEFGSLVHSVLSR